MLNFRFGQSLYHSSANSRLVQLVENASYNDTMRISIGVIDKYLLLYLHHL